MNSSRQVNRTCARSAQRGVALVVALLMLLVVTIISVTAARNSGFSLKMSSNLQDRSNSLQTAEAGLNAGLLVARADTPFSYQAEPREQFEPLAVNSPLAPGPNAISVQDPNSLDVFARRVSDADTTCPAMSETIATSNEFFTCAYFRIDSEHEVERRARTQTSLGLGKRFLN